MFPCMLRSVSGGTPSPPESLESSHWQNFPRKIRLSKNLRVKIRKTKDFDVSRTGFARTLADAMIAHSKLPRKVRCHKVDVQMSQ